MGIKTIIFIFLIIISGESKSQVKDTLKLNEFSLGGTFNKGNSNNFQATVRSIITYTGHKSKYDLILTPNYFTLYSQEGGSKMIKKSEDARVDLYFNLKFKRSFSLVVFSNAEHSMSKKIDLAISGGIGILKVYKYNELKINLSISPCYDYMLISNNWIGSFRSSIKGFVFLPVKNTNTTFSFLYQPSLWSQSGFTREKNTNSKYYFEVAKKIAKKIMTGIVYESWSSSLPVSINGNIKKTDQRISFMVKYSR